MVLKSGFFLVAIAPGGGSGEVREKTAGTDFCLRDNSLHTDLGVLSGFII